ncbi:hypothetical protein C8J57DRAFT_283822 [Mycena rebaudengoi]|nr:hypothetical protein C8J57DRAFT_283822 [Mycena rebaudengoi]
MDAIPAGLDLNLQSSYGVLLIGCFFSAIIWGISCVQTFFYFLVYENDALKIKILVLFLLAVDTANQILVLRSVWPALVVHWGRLDILAKSEGTLELIHHVWVAAIVAVGVQLFFIWRIYVFSGRKRLLPAFLIFLTSWQIIGLAPYYYLVFGIAPVSAGQQSKQLTAIAVSTRASTAAVDILIAISMIYLLVKPGPNNQFASTKKLVFRLMLLTINSGAWTAVLAVLDFICIVAFPTYFTFTIFELPLCSLYLSTMLANLNARIFITGEAPTSIDLSDRSQGRTTTGTAFEPIHFVGQSTRRTAFSSQNEPPTADTKKGLEGEAGAVDGYV